MTDERSSRRSLGKLNQLDKVLEHRLLLYALAAGTTLACIPSAQAEVVFTPSNIYYSGGNLDIDIDHDGTVDFIVQFLNLSCSSTSLHVRARSCESAGRWYLTPPVGASGSNGLATKGTRSYAAALIRGNLIGRPQDNFTGKFLACSGSGTGGYWRHDTYNRYLGVKFNINGEVHYGWIGFIHSSFERHSIRAHFGGWAYETVPNKPIHAGDQGTGSEFPASFDPHNATSLELRAIGHVSQPALRNRAGEPKPVPVGMSF